MVRLTREQVAAGEHREYDPERHDFRWNEDFTECVIVPLAWWDDASYAEYQGDGSEGLRS
jgi:hypothetical protein